MISGNARNIEPFARDLSFPPGSHEYPYAFITVVIYGQELLQGVTCSSKEGERKKIALQAKWCILNDVRYEYRNEKTIQKGPFHIRNLSVLADRARRFSVTSANADRMTIKFLADTGRALASIRQSCKKAMRRKRMERMEGACHTRVFHMS